MNREWWLAGYRHGASNARALAGTREFSRVSAIYADDGHIEGVKDVKAEKATRFALGKGRVKLILRTTVMARAAHVGQDFEAGYVDAMLDSVN